MSGGSTSAAGWSTRLERPQPPPDLLRRPDDPRLGECVEFWSGDPAVLTAGRLGHRPVLVGFPQDEGVQRNHGRPGAAEAPREIRRWLYRLTPWDGAQDADLTGLRLLELGDLRIDGSSGGDLEASQAALGEVVGALLRAGTVPIILGGGHETAYGNY